MKYDMQLISHDELKRKLERKDHFKLVMALGTWGYRAKHIPGSLHFLTPEEALASLTQDDEIVVLGERASWPTSTWFITDTCMYAAMLAAFSTGSRLATRSKARWSRKASDHDNQACALLLNYALNDNRTARVRTKPD